MLRFSIRLSVILWGIVLIIALGYVLSGLLVFKQIFFQHAGIPITQVEALRAHNDNDTRPQQIPKIIHQVFHNWHDPGNDTLPKDWEAVRQTCVKANPEFDVKLWTEKTSRDFIEANYAWFLRTYDGYRYPVQRVDAVRYFLLLHYGGIYLDLDNGCKTDLTPLLYYPMWITDPGRGALSNNILASRPNHPFWARLTHSLYTWDYGYVFPYVTISYASGQWFETAIWEEYHKLLPKISKNSPNTTHDHRLHRLMMDDREGADPWVFFTQERGGSWVNWDNRMFLIIGDHLFLFLACLSITLSLVGFLIVKGIRRYNRGYALLKNQPDRHDA